MLFFIVTSLPVMTIYLIFEGFLRIGLISAFLISYSILFFYADKFLLFFLGAREINDADSYALFRVIKSNVFNAMENMPKVYLYSGNQAKAFAFAASSGWSMAIERSLLTKLTNDEMKAVTTFLIENKKSGKAWFQTKCMGITGGILKVNTWLISVLFRWTGSNKLINSLTVISLMFLKPIIEIINLLNYSGKIQNCPPTLKSIFYNSLEDDKVTNFNNYLSMQLITKLNQREIIRSYLESYPVFERCDFNRELIQ